MRWCLAVAVGVEIVVSTTALAQTVPHLRNVVARTRVSPVDASGIRTFEYRLLNGATSDGPLSSFDVSISRNNDTLQLPLAGLAIHIGATVESFATQINDSGIDGSALVPAGCSGPSGWNCGIGTGGWPGVNGWVGFFEASDSSNGIAPNASTPGFILRSPGLPGIVPARAEPDYYYVTKDGDASDEDSEAARIAYQEIIFPMQVVGPVAPPNVFEPLLFTRYIRELMHQAQALGWIRSDHVEDALERRLDRLESVLKRGKSREALEVGRAFLDLLEDASCRRHDCDEREAITSDADGLLRCNMEYLLAQLQPEVTTKAGERDRDSRR